MARILLIEDDEDFARVLLLHLARNGYEVDHASDGMKGLEFARSGSYALILLDVSLPKLDGFDVLAQLRAGNSSAAVVMLTSRSEEIDKIAGFDLGADDYVTKPFSVAELMARIRARLRNVPSSSLECTVPELIFGPLVINLASRKVYRNKAEVELTAMEFDILEMLSVNAGQAFSQEEILERFWTESKADYSKSLHNLIMRVRKKIETDPGHPEYLKTVRGYGYRFTTPEELENDGS